MATYYHGNSEIQGGDGLQTLILMNPGYVGYSDTQSQPPPGGNFVFLNSPSAGNSLNYAGLSHAPPPHTQQFVGVPLPLTASTAVTAPSQDPHNSSVHSRQDMSALHGFIPRVQCSIYNPVELTAGREVTRGPQGLSLSLSSQQPGYGYFRPDREVPSTAPITTISPTSCADVRVSGGSSSSASGISNCVNGMQSVLFSSKYLKAAQELLDEVVNVGKVIKNTAGFSKGTNGQTKNTGESLVAVATGDGPGEGEGNTKRGADLSTVERQEIQMKKAKLVNMLDEVEQRYRQYHQQMQIVISWFEQAAGIGSAKTYTALALQTISKQFRCLKDAIMGQIRAASKTLGEDEFLGLGAKTEGSRLKYVDNQLRQQRALQQLGMIQHNAWRPQRGLPERSVSVLRAWLFEHFLHPYPKDSDKIMLAKQTGLTRSQVSNWFINARVRLWKPMVEEMYTEEMKELKQNGSEEKTSNSEQNEDSGPKSCAAQQEKSLSSENQNKIANSKQEDNLTNQTTHPAISFSAAASTSGTGVNLQNHSSFTLIRPSELESITQGSPKKPRGSEFLNSPVSVASMGIELDGDKSADENFRHNRDGFTLMGAPTNFIGGLGSYPIGDIGRFGSGQFAPPYAGNGVSLTLGLPHCDLSVSGNHQNFLPNQNIQLGRGVEIGEVNEFGSINTPTSSHSAGVYESINLQNRKRFAAQLLRDFVT